ncbi:hypothetical protein [Ruminiclostridium papyrosolvens]|uniref:Uncharacterized protein n=1 Tax=Ruminiclostridium papyrosolvens C7 TaxID=1330534 RepID=U4R586_9FIRM|nr:hypothetical protein [Ruminiclostridium papyrosolvens]EPR13190.1 hypothetical protein L323_04670 [Ruminiclostridium papyrosolvens C7]
METSTLKRVLAWILLAGFVFLLLNITIFHVLIVPSVAVYLIIAIFFLFSRPRLARENKNLTDTTARQETEPDTENNK